MSETKAEAYESALQSLHDKAPPPFNPQFRPGFREACEKAHREMEANEPPGVTRAERAAKYREVQNELAKRHPSIEELGQK